MSKYMYIHDHPDLHEYNKDMGQSILLGKMATAASLTRGILIERRGTYKKYSVDILDDIAAFLRLNGKTGSKACVKKKASA